MTGEKCSVVLLDRQPLWLDELETLLSNGGIDVIAKSTDPDEVIEVIAKRRPDVLIAEVDGSDENAGLESIRRARSAHPNLRPVVLSTSDDPMRIEAAFHAGACVYCVKTALADDLLSAVRQAVRHSIYVAWAPENGAPHENGVVREFDGLTKREVEILRLVAEGYSNSQVAQVLWVTEQTVKFHLSNIYRKLNVSNRTEASRWAQLHGLLSAVDEKATTAA